LCIDTHRRDRLLELDRAGRLIQGHGCPKLGQGYAEGGQKNHRQNDDGFSLFNNPPVLPEIYVVLGHGANLLFEPQILALPVSVPVPAGIEQIVKHGHGVDDKLVDIPDGAPGEIHHVAIY
jgi:hypothetical protein